MGVKEDNSPRKVLKGYSGQIRPGHCVGGKCVACGEEVWVKAKPGLNGRTFSGIDYVHHGCVPLGG